jgi:hypothetical protein
MDSSINHHLSLPQLIVSSAHIQLFHPISIDQAQLSNRILLPARYNHPELSLFHYSMCSGMAIDKLSRNDLLIPNVPGAPQPEDTPHNESIDSEQPDLTCTPDPTQTKTYRQVFGVENAGG